MLPPLSAKDWSVRAAGHLLNRAGFSGSPEEIARVAAKGLDRAVDELLTPVDESKRFPKPSWAVPENKAEERREMRSASDDEERQMMRRMERRESMREMVDLRAGWLARMRDSSCPLREKMTLFWHGHFATSMEKVRDSYLLWLQNETFRRHALGNFGDLTKAISRDPAMMVYLDMVQSRRREPNENFARELMELFTLGEGKYTEQDIREAARAFTGYKIDQRSQEFYFVKLAHDPGEKEFFGKRGTFAGDDIIDCILAKPECAHFVVRKLWAFFAYDDPPDGLVRQLADAFRSARYELRPVLREIFRSAEFYGPKAYRTQIKSPVQWIVQTARTLETNFEMSQLIQNGLRQMGQTLFAPPNVKGWDGGRAWISTSTLLFRYNLANAIVNGDLDGVVDRGGRGMRAANRRGRSSIDLGKIAPEALRQDAKQLVDALCIRLFQDPLGTREREAFYQYAQARSDTMNDEVIRGLLHLMMSTPQFQLC